MFMECASLALRMRICMCVCVCTIVRACILAQRRNAAGFLGGHCLWVSCYYYYYSYSYYYYYYYWSVCIVERHEHVAE